MMSFSNRLFILGCGGVAQCVIPLIFKHIDIDPKRITVMDFADNRDKITDALAKGVNYVTQQLTEDNYDHVLKQHLSSGDLFIDLSWNVDTVSMLDWCYKHNVLYVNTSIEVWDPYYDAEKRHPTEFSLYTRQMALQKLQSSWDNPKKITAILEHGANPGLVSHFTKQALIDIAKEVLKSKQNDALKRAVEAKDFPKIAHLLSVKTIHISERDTQITHSPKEVNEFVNTWSIQGLIEEGIAPAEIGWGTHETTLPIGAMNHKEGPKNQISLSQRGMKTWVRSWVPSGPITGMVIRHGEAYSISHFLTVTENGTPVYRPTVHYAYCPCDAAINSLHEMVMNDMVPQTKQRILSDDIISGHDELGCLLMGHPLKAWWIGSILDINAARKLVPNQNATTVQVSIGVVAAAMYAIRHPHEGICLPDHLDYEEILQIAKPYLGTFVSKQVDWSPLDAIKDHLDFNEKRPSSVEEWQFTTFLDCSRLKAKQLS